ncbi:MAG: MATE family efflux transporter, partial [Lachnospiraceae bacterium]|nr:MATE family efflux transporter [Lachnospiraceae bacterium]
DRIYLGHIEGEGKLALTGVGVAFPLITIITAFTNMFGQGGSPLFAMDRGKGDDESAGRIMGNSCGMMVLLSFVIMAAVFAFKRPILYLFGASDATYGYADRYISVYVLGTLFSMLSIGMNTFINAQGFGTIGMLSVAIGAVTNIILDPIFIFGMDMGVVGAALATILSQLVSAVWVIRFLTGKKVPVRLRLSQMKLSFPVIKRIVSLGLTPFIMSATTGMVSAMYNKNLQIHGGDIYVTAMTVILSIREMLNMGLQGMTRGAGPVISYNYGAKLYDRTCGAIRFLGWFSVIYSTVVWLIITLFPKALLSIFNSDPELMEIGPAVVRTYYSMHVFMALQAIGQNTFLSLGMAKHGMFFSMLRKIVIVTPLIFILPHFITPPVFGVVAAEPVSDVIGGCACFITMYFTVYRKLKAGEPLASSRKKNA